MGTLKHNIMQLERLPMINCRRWLYYLLWLGQPKISIHLISLQPNLSSVNSVHGTTVFAHYLRQTQLVPSRLYCPLLPTLPLNQIYPQPERELTQIGTAGTCPRYGHQELTQIRTAGTYPDTDRIRPEGLGAFPHKNVLNVH